MLVPTLRSIHFIKAARPRGSTAQAALARRSACPPPKRAASSCYAPLQGRVALQHVDSTIRRVSDT